MPKGSFLSDCNTCPLIGPDSGWSSGLSRALVADHLRERVDDLKARLLEVSEECSKEYRRGYLAGRAASRRGDELDLKVSDGRA